MNTLMVGFALFQAATQGTNAQVLTVDEAVRLAVEQAFSVRSARTSAARSREVVRQVEGLLGPRVGLDATYARFAERQPSFSGGSGPIDSKTASGTISMPIDITGTIRDSVRAARYAEAAQLSLVQNEINGIKFEARNAYFGVVNAQSQVDVQRRTVESAKGRLDQGRLKVQAGTFSQFDVLRLETDVQRAEAGLVQAQSRLSLAKQSLNNLLARPIETQFVATEPETSLPTVEAEDQELTNVAMQTNPLVRASELGVRAREATVRAEAGGSRPNLGVSLSHQENLDPGAFQQRRSTTGAAQLTWTVYDSGITRARTNAARRDVESAQIQLDQVRLGTSLQVRSALTALNDARTLLAVAEKNLALQEEAYRLAQVRFENQVGVLLDITTAQEQLTAAQTVVLNARASVRTAFAQLQQAVGSDDLRPVEAAQGDKK